MIRGRQMARTPKNVLTENAGPESALSTLRHDKGNLCVPTGCDRCFAESGDAPEYAAQLKNLQASVDKIYSDVSPRPSTPSEYQSLADRLFALRKTCYRLHEESGQADLNSMQQGNKSDKQLSLVGLGCVSIDAIITALENYVLFDDMFFLSLATDSRRTTDTIAKLLQ
jgi:hypothetical protein